MSPLVATIVYSFGIWGLFFLNRDRKNKPSPALWIPIAWLLINGSRPVSTWFGGPAGISPEQLMEGSPFDRLVYLGLQIAGVVVLLGRQASVLRFLRANRVLIAFLFYCAASIVWSDYPDVTFKRWIKLLGDITMVLIVLTSRDPIRAIKTVLTRVSFLLVPISILLIKYYPALSRAYDAWTGAQYVSGVGTDKNMLGMMCLIYGLGMLWQFLGVLREARGRDRNCRLLANGIFLALLFWLFSSADSMTSLSCFLMGSFVILVTTSFKTIRQSALVHTMVLGVAGVAFAVLFLHVGEGAALQKMGRNATLTGRTEIWAGVLGFAGSPLLGTGFDSFWLGDRLSRIWASGGFLAGINEAHNGYIETYLNLGWIGVCLLAALIAAGYRNILKTLRGHGEIGSLKLALFIVAIVYNYTEAGFRTNCAVWVAFLLATVAAPDAPMLRRPRLPPADNSENIEYDKNSLSEFQRLR